MIVYELHLIKNSSAKRTKAIKQLSKGISSILLLSGTPILNRPVEIFNSLQMIDPKTWDNWWSFVKRYCNAHQGRFGWDVSGATNIDELKQRISTYFLRRTKEEVLPDLPQKHFIDFPVEMPRENAYQYQVLLNSFIKYLKEVKQKKGREIMKTMRAEHLAKLNELRQLTSISKIEPAKELIQNIINNDEKVLIFSNYKNSLYALYEEFKKNAVIITGDISNQDREKAIENFQNDPNTKIFLGGIKSAGVGITLTSGNNVVFIDHSWVPADHSQAIDRVHRIGQKANQVTIYQLYCDGTIDEKMKKILEEKQNIFDKIFENNTQKEESNTIDTLVQELEKEN
jgi:SWI/SNF-related matrix-associated actin-dependent regulator 1 of chromatin subfamily A